MNNPIANLLHADGPHPDLGDNALLYGRFIGSWDMVNHQYDEQRDEWFDTSGEVHFGWVLGGRAVQDLWGAPDRGYGTTLRSYDPSIDAWRVEWLSPRTRSHCSLIGRAQGDRIVQYGRREDGRAIRWSFTEITDDGFVWRGETSPDHGAAFRFDQEMRCTRRRTAAQPTVGGSGHA